VKRYSLLGRILRPWHLCLWRPHRPWSGYHCGCHQGCHKCLITVKKYAPHENLSHTEIYASGSSHRPPPMFHMVPAPWRTSSPWTFAAVPVCVLLKCDLFVIAKFAKLFRGLLFCHAMWTYTVSQKNETAVILNILYSCKSIAIAWWS